MRILLLPVITAVALMVPVQAMAQDACDIQKALAEKGFYRGDITCTIGPRTSEAIENFQRDRGLSVDGVVGEDTRKALFEDDGEERKSPRPVIERRELSDQERFARCGDDIVEQSAERFGKGRALTGAKKSWESKVYSTEGLGIRYGDWANAEDKSEECFPASAGAKFTWNCTVKARPCKAGE